MDTSTDKDKVAFSWLQLIKAVLFLAGDRKKAYLFWTIALIFTQLYSVVPMLILGKVVDVLTAYSQGGSLNLFYIYLTVLTVLSAVVAFARVSIKKRLAHVQFDLNYRARVMGFEKLMDYSLSWHDSEVTGNKFQRIQNGTQELKSLANILTNNIYPVISSLIGVVAVFVFLHPPYILFFAVYTFLFCVILAFFYKKTEKLNTELNKVAERASGTYVEGIGNVLTIKSSGAESSFNKLVSEQEDKQKTVLYARQAVSTNLWRTFQVFNALAFGIFLFMAGFDVIAGVITVGSIVIFYGYLNQLIGSATTVLSTYQQILMAKSGIGRMMSIIWAEGQSASGDKQFPNDWDAIRLQDIEFHYDNSHGEGASPDLHNLSVSIERNARVGIVGKTGCGKSTFTKMLMGLYQPKRGTYTIGKTDFFQIQHEEVSRKMAIVLQDSEMFNLSLRDNIMLMRSDDQELLDKAIAIAQLERVIDKLPQGLDTIIGEKGYHLSGGERQRIGIARAICREPQIIIFDESTSSLDSETERKIQEAIEKELNDTTLIFVAHRISTLENMDTILVFADGQVVESGTYSDLGENENSTFFRLYKANE